MNNKGASFLFVSHDNRFTIRRYLSPFAIKLLIAAGAIGLGVLIFLAVSYVPIYYRALQVEYFSRRNREIEEDFKALNELKNELSYMRRENARIRQMLGVERTPAPPTFDNAISAYAPGIAATAIAGGNGARSVPSITPTIGFISNDYQPNHRGVDIAAPLGAMIIAPADGVVKQIGWDSLYGNFLILKHTEAYETFYGHLNAVAVIVGQRVNRNDVIGHVGSSGRSTAPHLHYVVMLKGEAINPKPYMN